MHPTGTVTSWRVATDRCGIQSQDVTGVAKIKYQMGPILWAQYKHFGQNADAAVRQLSPAFTTRIANLS